MPSVIARPAVCICDARRSMRLWVTSAALSTSRNALFMLEVSPVKVTLTSCRSLIWLTSCR